MFVSAVLAACAVLAFTGCGRKAPEIPEAGKDSSVVVAVVGDQPVTLAMVRAVAAQNDYDIQKSQGLQLALRDAVNIELLAAEARKHGYDRDPDIQRYVKSQSIQKLLLATVDKPGAGEIQAPAEKELETYYQQNAAEFTQPALLRGQVLALLKRQGQEAEFQQKLDAVRAAVAAKELPFRELVKQFSDDPQAANSGGITNWMIAGEPAKQYPQSLVDALFAAPDQSTVIGPIENGDWVYFAKVHERRDARVEPFEQAKPQITNKLARKKRVEAYDAFVEQIKGDTPVRIFADKAEAEIKAKTKQGGPPLGPVAQ